MDEKASALHYGVLQSVADGLRALALNRVPNAIALALAFCVQLAAMLALNAAIPFLQPRLNPLALMSAIMLGGLIVSIVAPAFTLSISVSAVFPHPKRPAPGLLFESSRQLGRAILASLLGAAIIFWPLALLMVVIIVSQFGAIGGANFSLAVLSMPILALVGLIWGVIALMRIALVPYLAVLEPELPILHTPRRSKQLLVPAASGFIARGVGIALAGGIVISLVDHAGMPANFPLATMLVCPLALLANIAFVMLYRRLTQRPVLDPAGEDVHDDVVSPLQGAAAGPDEAPAN